MVYKVFCKNGWKVMENKNMAFEFADKYDLLVGIFDYDLLVDILMPKNLEENNLENQINSVLKNGIYNAFMSKNKNNIVDYQYLIKKLFCCDILTEKKFDDLMLTTNTLKELL